MTEDERRQIARGGDGVVHETAREELAGVVVDEPLAERLAHALSDSAVHLSLHDEGIDHGAAVLHHDVALHADPTGGGVYLDRGHVHRAGEGGPGRIEALDGLEARRAKRAG